jgi:predicted house-cleaning noncanonical NTP pyrophosphatase (MazG superfamily)
MSGREGGDGEKKIVRVDFKSRTNLSRRPDHPLSEANISRAKVAKGIHDNATENAPLMHKLSDFIFKHQTELRDALLKEIENNFETTLIHAWKINVQLEESKDSALYRLAESLSSMITEKNIEDIGDFLQVSLQGLFVSPPRRIRVTVKPNVGAVSLGY